MITQMITHEHGENTVFGDYNSSKQNSKSTLWNQQTIPVRTFTVLSKLIGLEKIESN